MANVLDLKINAPNYVVEVFSCKFWDIITMKTANYWTKDRCKKEARKYQTRTLFAKKSGGCYQKAWTEGWLDDICKHMKSLIKPNGYWTKDRCLDVAKKCKTRTEFNRSFCRAWEVCRENNWLDEACSHMTELIKSDNYWTKENCHKAALSFKNRNLFAKKYGAAYNKARLNGWLDDICSHMEWINRPNGYWTKERCAEEALKFASRNEYLTKSGGSYKSAKNNGWLDEICSHMESKIKPKGYWSYENCLKESLKYKYKDDFAQACNGAYSVSLKNDWLNTFYPKRKPYKLSQNHKNKIRSGWSKRKKTKKEFLIAAKIMHGEDTYNYNEFIYVDTHTKGKIICSNKEHPPFFQTPRDHAGMGNGCPCCKSSRGERKLLSILSKLDIHFIYQKAFKDLRSNKNKCLFFDFYLPDFNILIEYDGHLHFGYMNNGWNNKNNHLKTKNHDLKKNKYCVENKIKLIRIPYTMEFDLEYIISKEYLKGFPRSINYSKIL